MLYIVVWAGLKYNELRKLKPFTKVNEMYILLINFVIEQLMVKLNWRSSTSSNNRCHWGSNLIVALEGITSNNLSLKPGIY